MSVIRTLAFKSLFYGLTPIWAITMLAMLVFPTYRPLYRGIEIWADFIVFLLNHVAGIRVEVRGADNLPLGDPFILVGKHESTVDGFLMVRHVTHLTAIGKRELFSIPALGQLLRKMKIIPVKRGTGKAYEDFPDLVERVVLPRRPLLIYPEGTRTRPGQQQPLKTGAYHIHQQTGLPVYTSTTNSGLFWPHHEFLMRRGTIVLEFHDALEPDLPKDRFMAEVEKLAILRGAEL